MSAADTSGLFGILTREPIVLGPSTATFASSRIPVSPPPRVECLTARPNAACLGPSNREWRFATVGRGIDLAAASASALLLALDFGRSVGE
jgi:hypothetical protein